MEIIRGNKSYSLTIDEVKEAAQEWEHLLLMQRIVKYLADYYDLPLSADQHIDALEDNLARFYETYHFPFSLIVDSAYDCEPEDLVNCPDQVYLFLSTLAQSYDHDEDLSELPEEDAFRLMFQEKETQINFVESNSKIINLGIYIQNSDKLVIGDPSIPNDHTYLCQFKDVLRGVWSCAVSEVTDSVQPFNQQVSYLLAKSDECPFTFQQMLEQLFFWNTYPNSITTMNGAVGLFDAKYYQDPTTFGKLPVTKDSVHCWVDQCLGVTLEYPYAGILPHGVISSSGAGEGSYDAYYMCNIAGNIIAIVVDFLLDGG